jgi:hypothetical protein
MRSRGAPAVYLRRMITRGIIVLTLLTLLTGAAGCSSETPTSPATSASPTVPVAKDGQNYTACTDGACEVLIRQKAALNLSGEKFTATVLDGALKLTDSKGYISLSKSGSDVSRSGGGSAGGASGGLAAVSWSEQGGPLHIATLTYAEGDTVIVTFATK